MTTFEEFQKRAMKTAIKNDSCFNLLYASNALCGEAGEFANMVKKFYRDGKDIPEERAKEIFDIMWYCAYICEIEGFSFEDILELGFDKLNQRQVMKLPGSGTS